MALFQSTVKKKPTTIFGQTPVTYTPLPMTTLGVGSQQPSTQPVKNTGGATGSWTSTAPVTQPAQPTAPTAPVAPKPTTTSTYNDPTPAFLQRTQELQKQQEQQLRQAQERKSGYYNNLYNQRNADLKAQLPGYDQEQQQVEAQSAQRLADQEKNRAIQQQQLDDQYGEAQRQLAQTRREGESRNMQKFAGQNAIDSAGVGSYQQAQTNNESDFLRMTNKNLMQKIAAKTAKDSEINAEVYKIQDYALSEKKRLDAAKRQVMSDIRLNDQQKYEAIMQLEDDTEAKLLEAQDYVNNLNYQAQLSKYNSDVKVSETGATTNQAKQGLVSVVDELLGRDNKPITGALQLGALVPGSDAQRTKNLYEQLKGMLSLENRAQLKGSGAISDFEAKTLEQAASALGRNLSSEDFAAELMKIKQVLQGANGAVNNPSDPLGLGI